MLKTSVVLSIWLSGLAQPVIQGSVQSPEQDGATDIEKHRQTLLQPGPDAREGRETAVHALLVMKERRAHEVLQEMLARGDDSDHLSRFVLDQLRPRMGGSTNDPIFGDSDLRPELVRSYCRVLVSYFADGDERPAADPQELQPVVLGCLRALNALERQQVLTALFDDQDPELARASLLSAGGCRDLGLAPLVAKRLGNPALAGAARSALEQLTFASTPFSDEQAFLDWQRNNRGRGYIELAEEAARRRRAFEEDLRKSAAEAVRVQTVKLVRALARADQEDWRALELEILGGGPGGDTPVYLDALREILAAKVRLGGVTADRQAFAAAVRARMNATVTPEERALLLETFAYLAVREDADQSAAAIGLLRGGLSHVAPAVRQAACRGLARYPSVENRIAVIQAAERALAIGDHDTLREALACICASDWRSPSAADPDRAAWLAILRNVFALPTDEVSDPALKERALDVAILPDGEQTLVGEVFPMLLEVSGSPDQPVSLRQQVLIRLYNFTRDEQRAEAYIDHMLGLFASDDAGIRRHVASQLMSLPEANKERQRIWNERILQALAARLRLEPDKRALDAVVKCMLHIGEQPERAAMAIGRLYDAVLTMTADGAGGGEPFRREAIAEGLRILGGRQGRALGLWTAAARGLARLGDRESLRRVLERHGVANLVPQADDPGYAEAMRLVIEAATMSTNQPWSARKAEAEEVRLAFERLDALGFPLESASHRVLRVEALAALDGRDVEVIKVGTQALSVQDNPLSEAGRVPVVLAVARAYLNLQQIEDAQAQLASLEARGVDSAQARQLWVEIAERLLLAGKSKEAAELLPRILQKTSKEGPHYRKVLLLDIEAQFTVDPTANREAARKRLLDHATLFTGDGVPPPLAEQYETLKRRVEG